jgi:arsenite/tail-anchored protein-transporting ATPase
VIATLDERISRLQQFHARLTSRAATAFVLVLIPERLPIDETARAAEQLAEAGVDIGTIVVNQVVPESAAGDFIEARRAQEAVHLARIERVFAGYRRVRVPRRPTDVHGLADLEAMAAALFAT